MGFEIGRWTAGHRCGGNGIASVRVTHPDGEGPIVTRGGAIVVRGTMPSVYAGETMTLDLLWHIEVAPSGNHRFNCQFFRHGALGSITYYSSLGWSNPIGIAGGLLMAPPDAAWGYRVHSTSITQAQTTPAWLYTFGGGAIPSNGVQAGET